MNKLFPIFIKLENLQMLVVGGGNVGLEKLNAILVNCPEANILLVSPFIKDEIKALASNYKNLKLEYRKFNINDIENKHVVICATDDIALHKEIYEATRIKNILINVADTPELCDFYLSSIVRKGDLKIAISTNGKSPTFAKRLKETINEALDSENINELLQGLTYFRDQLKGNFNEKVKELNELTKVLKNK